MNKNTLPHERKVPMITGYTFYLMYAGYLSIYGSGNGEAKRLHCWRELEQHFKAKNTITKWNFRFPQFVVPTTLFGGN